MSSTVEEHLNALRGMHHPQALAEVKVNSPQEKAKGNVESVFEVVAKGVGGFAAYFVIGDEFHDEQHTVFCQEMGLDPGPYNRAIRIGDSGTASMILRREVQVDKMDVAHGLYYAVEFIPHDRD